MLNLFKKYITQVPLLLIFISCCSGSKSIYLKTGSVPQDLSKIFLAGYKYVWMAATKEMERFPVKIINKNAGIIITEDINTFDDAYETYADRKFGESRSEIQYRIEVRIKPLEQTGKYPRTEVRVAKLISKKLEFGDERTVQSNLFDEKVILYRINRILKLERLKIEKNRR